MMTTTTPTALTPDQIAARYGAIPSILTPDQIDDCYGAGDAMTDAAAAATDAVCGATLSLLTGFPGHVGLWSALTRLERHGGRVTSYVRYQVDDRTWHEVDVTYGPHELFVRDGSPVLLGCRLLWWLLGVLRTASADGCDIGRDGGAWVRRVLMTLALHTK